MGTSIVFDRAADYYDSTRGLSPATQSAVIGLLAAELRDRGRCLEVGVGTGRIALDLHRQGVAMAGVDLSRPMLAKLVEKSDGAIPFPLAIADATALPVADGQVGAVVVCHVLHLIEAWRQAVEEMVRALRPGGVILVETAEANPGPAGDTFRHFWSLASPGGRPRRPGLSDHAELDAALGDAGFRMRTLEPVVERSRIDLAQVIDGLEAGIQSACWELSDGVRRDAAAATREWARERFGSLEATHDRDRTITWRAYDAP